MSKLIDLIKKKKAEKEAKETLEKVKEEKEVTEVTNVTKETKPKKKRGRPKKKKIEEVIQDKQEAEENLKELETKKEEILKEFTKEVDEDIIIPDRKEGVTEETKEEQPIDSPPEISLDNEPEAPKLSITEKLNLMNEKFDEIIQLDKKPGKKKKLFGFGVNTKLKGLAKKNEILVILLKINRGAEALVCEIKDGLIKVKDNYHKCTTDFIFLWNGRFPCIFLPEWDLQPIGTADFYKAEKEGRSSSAAKTIISMIEKKEVLNQKKLSGKALIWILIGGAIVAYVLFAGS